MQSDINMGDLSRESFTIKPGCVSVIIPLYNAMDTISRCIDSVKKQVYTNYEVILVDDCSEDQSCEFVSELCENDAHFRLIRQKERKGAGAARNIGMTMACGEFLYFFDADDEMEPLLLQNAVTALQESDADFVAFNFYKVFTDGTVKEENGVYAEKLPKGIKCFNYTDCPDTIMNAINPPPWDKLFRRSFVMEKGVKFEELYSSNDITFSAVLSAMANKITCLTDHLYRYYVGHANTITSQKTKRIGDMVEAVESACRQVRELPYFNLIEKAAQYFTVQKYLYAFEHFVPDWHAIQAKDYYQAIRNRFNSEWFTCWDREENCFLSDREAQLFLAIRQTDYDTFLSLQSRRLIVSLTSYPARIRCVAPVVHSILNQSHRADEIVLWLASEQFPGGETDLPDELLSLKRDGALSIEWCFDDLKPHKKYYYALQKYCDCIVVTVDDDILYPTYLLDRLYLSYLRYPNAVSACRTHLIPFEADGTILPYALWPKSTEYLQHQPCIQLMVTGCGGALYPPHCFRELLDEKDALVATCLMADDLWLKMLELHNSVPVVQAGKLYKLNYVQDSQETALWHRNLGENQNDVQLQNIIRWYDGRFGEGTFIRLLSDSSCGVPQIGLTAYANHIHHEFKPAPVSSPKAASREFRYPAARIDFRNWSDHADSTNAIEFFPSSSSLPKEAGWANGRLNGQQYFLETKDKNIHLTFQAKGTGILKIMLKGICMRNQDGIPFPWWVGYTKLTVNGEAFLEKPVLCWHNHSITISIPCEDQQLFELNAEWNPGEEYIGKLISESEKIIPLMKSEGKETKQKSLHFLKKCASAVIRRMRLNK